VLASFGQRFQRLLGELLDPMFGFGFVEIMIEELPWVCDKIGEPSVVIKADEWGWDATGGLEEAYSSHGKA
jgi:hypothetical protein